MSKRKSIKAKQLSKYSFLPKKVKALIVFEPEKKVKKKKNRHKIQTFVTAVYIGTIKQEIE